MPDEHRPIYESETVTITHDRTTGQAILRDKNALEDFALYADLYSLRRALERQQHAIAGMISALDQQRLERLREFARERREREQAEKRRKSDEHREAEALKHRKNRK